MGEGVTAQAGSVFTRVFPGARAVLVADGNTWAVAGPAVESSLAGQQVGMDPPIIYPGAPPLYADGDVVADLTRRLGGAVAVSIGAGSLNDVTKLASHRAGRGYLHVCTAASVDGYTSFGASITVDGVKTTHECPAPRAVIVALDVMAAAPGWLTATGYGDLVEKVPAGADWIIADELGLDPIDEVAWNLVQSGLREALGDPGGLAKAEIGPIRALAEALIMSGLSMQVCSSSRPASGAGHYFSHQWEMEGFGRDWRPPLSHGYKVGLGAVAMCALYEQVLDLPLASIDIDARLATWPTPAQDASRVRALQPHPGICRASLGQSAEKYLSPDRARVRLELIRDRWNSIRTRVAAQVMPVRIVEQMLREVGAIHHPAQIGLSLEQLRTKYYQAQTIRARYTVLDLLQETGHLNLVVDSLFAPGGYWQTRIPI